MAVRIQLFFLTDKTTLFIGIARAVKCELMETAELEVFAFDVTVHVRTTVWDTRVLCNVSSAMIALYGTRTESVHIYYIYIYISQTAKYIIYIYIYIKEPIGEIVECCEYTHVQYVRLQSGAFDNCAFTNIHAPLFAINYDTVGNCHHKNYGIVLAGTASVERLGAHMRTGRQVTDCGLFCARVFTVIIPYIPGAEINRTVSCFLVHSKICPTSYKFLSVYSFCFSTALSHQCF